MMSLISRAIFYLFSLRTVRVALCAFTALIGSIGLQNTWAAEPILHLSGDALEVSQGVIKHQVGAAAAIEAAVGRAQLQEITYGEALLMGLAIIMNDNDNDGEPATFTGGSGSNFAGGSG